MNAATIDRVASDWVARMDAAKLTTAQDAELQAWLASDVRHLGAFARARAVFLRADRAQALRNGADLHAFVSEPVEAVHSPRRKIALWAAAAALVFCAFAGWQWQGSLNQRYETGLGEVRRIPLSDGSAMTLNTSSRVTVSITDHLRSVRLDEGEALFDVAKDAARPFVVVSDNTRVMAVGTSFSVRRLADDRVEVVVREGLVRIESDGPGTGSAIPLSANMRAVAAKGATPAISNLRNDAVAQHLSWRDGMISFDGDTLSEAAAEFNRYSRTRILVDQPQVAEMRVVGLFAANDPEGFAQSVALSFGLEALTELDSIHLRLPESPDSAIRSKSATGQ